MVYAHNEILYVYMSLKEGNPDTTGWILKTLGCVKYGSHESVNSVWFHLLEVPAAAAAAESLQLCPTLCDPIDGSPPGSPVPGILQARTLEWYLEQSNP